MTPEQMRRLGELAARIAIEAPLNRSRWSPTTYVRWDTVDEIRKELEGCGVDWRGRCKQRREQRGFKK